MARRPTDPDLDFAWMERQRTEEHYRDEAWEREARFDETHWSTLPLCPVCERHLDARLLCAACGNSGEMAA